MRDTVTTRLFEENARLYQALCNMEDTVYRLLPYREKYEIAVRELNKTRQRLLAAAE